MGTPPYATIISLSQSNLFEFLLDVIFPRQCLGCGKFGKYFCDQCQKDKIDYFPNQVCPYCEKSSPYGYPHPRCAKPQGIDGLFVLAHYRGIIPQAIHEIKYNGAYAITSELAQLILQKYHGHFQFNYLVPVPLSKKRERDRGFNQAEKLANSLAKSLRSTDYRLSPSKKAVDRSQLAVVKVLERIKETRPQFDLKYKDRQKNMIGAFALNHELITKNLSGVSFCLVDDVATTGATLFECAKVLKIAGAEKVYGITIARGG